MERRANSTQARACATIILLACCPCGSALNPSLEINQYAHKAWTVRDGFFKSGIQTIAQTPDGYLWLASDYELLRFDGVKAVSWQPPGVTLGRYPVLLATRDGTLWIGARPGLVSWKNSKLTQFPDFAQTNVDGLVEDREGKVWASSSFPPPVRLCSIQFGKTQCLAEDVGFGESLARPFEDSEGNLWAGAADGVWRRKPGPPRFYRLPKLQNGYPALAEGDDGALWISTPDGIKRLVDGKTEVIYPSPPGLRPFYANHMLRDRDGGLWLATSGRGLAHVHDGRTDVFGQSDGLSGNLVTGLFEDREGSIWAATLNGLDRFRDFAIPTYSISQGLSNATITSVLAARDGSIWVGTFDGLNRWDRGQLTIYRERHRPTPAGVREIVGPGLPDRGVHSMFQDHRGRIWISDRHGTGYLEQDRFVPVKGVPGGNVQCIVGDNAGGLWIASQQLSHVLPGNVVEPIPWARFGDAKVGEPLVWDPFRGGLWVGFLGGGIAYFAGAEVRASYEAADGLGKGSVVRLRIDRAGALWASTEGGLSRLKDGRLSTLNSRNGLPCDGVPWSIEDDAGSLWMNMVCGLVRIQHSELENWAAASEKGKIAMVRFTAFDNSDGARLVEQTTYSPQADKAPDGQIWFATPDGVGVIDPRDLHVNKLPPPVHIEEVRADGKPYEPSRGMRLPAGLRDVWIDYTALSLAGPEKVRFKYKLEGQDTEWKEVVNVRQAQYTNLAPRRYRFRVTACNNSGVWNETGDSLEFSVDAAYYQTAWFRAACLAAFLAMVWGLYRFRLYQIAERFNAHLEGRVDERLQVARDLHDTLLQSFQGLLLQFQGARNLLSRRPDDAGPVFDRALDEAARAITEARDTIQGMRSSTEITNDLAKAVEALGKDLAAEQRATNEGTTACSVEVEGAPQELHPILRDEVYRITGEALRNAFRHARAQRIEVEIRYDARKLRVRVRDDGAGIDTWVLQEGRAGHFGLPGMRERAKAIGGGLEVWSEQGAGTEVELTVPASVAYAKAAGRRSRVFKGRAGADS